MLPPSPCATYSGGSATADMPPPLCSTDATKAKSYSRGNEATQVYGVIMISYQKQH